MLLFASGWRVGVFGCGFRFVVCVIRLASVLGCLLLFRGDPLRVFVIAGEMSCLGVIWLCFAITLLWVLFTSVFGVLVLVMVLLLY